MEGSVVYRDLIKEESTLRAFKESSHRRHWWWKVDQADHEPLIYHLMTPAEKEMLRLWFEDTSSKKIIGECGPPFVSFLIGLISGNVIKRVVQLGHYAGYSSLVLGLALKKITAGKLATIDLLPEMSSYTQEWIERFQLADTVSVFTGDSADSAAAADMVDIIGGLPEVVVIDSAHTYGHTIKELDLWMPILAPNGFVILHDASEFAASFDSTNSGGVVAALDDWSIDNNYSYFSLNGGSASQHSPNELIYRDGCGLGIIQKR